MLSCSVLKFLQQAIGMGPAPRQKVSAGKLGGGQMDAQAWALHSFHLSINRKIKVDERPCLARRPGSHRVTCKQQKSFLGQKETFFLFV